MSTKKLLSAPLTILIGLSTINSAVSQSCPLLVNFPVLFEASSGSVDISKDAPPTPANGSKGSLKYIGKPYN